jgi:FkbM family methyltransferase
MKGDMKKLVQQVFNRFGLQVRRADQGVSYTNPYSEQVRLLQKQHVNCVFEIGAADGRDTIKYAEFFPHAQVVAFEPVPDSFAKLQQSTQYEPRISSVNAAMSDVVGTAGFNIAEWPDASSLFPANLTGSTFDDYNVAKKTIQVKTETIDNYCHSENIPAIDLLKMDAQGAELSILKGAEKMFEQKRVGLIYTEVNFLDIYQGAGPYDSIAAYLRTYDFQLHNLYDLFTNQKGQLTWGDAIFIRADLVD